MYFFSSQGNVPTLMPIGTQVLLVPRELGMRHLVSFYYSNGKWYSSYDWDRLKNRITGKTYYVATNGNNSNDGLSWGTALKSIHVAMAKADLKVLIIQAGLYKYEDSFKGQDHTNDLKILVEGGIAISSLELTMGAWAVNGTYNDVFQTTYAGTETPANVGDLAWLDSKGNPQQLIKRASVLEVHNNPGSYYVDGTKTVYVHTYNSRGIDENILVMATGDNFVSNNSKNLYYENISCRGGNLAFKSYNPNGTTVSYKEIVDRNCRFYFAYGTDGLDVRGQTMIFSKLSHCYQNYRDGFNYDANSVTGVLKSCMAYEESCTGFYNGRTGTMGGSDNGSTSHASCQVIRFDGEYSYNDGRNVHDIDTTLSLDITCRAGFSLATDPTAKANFVVGDANVAGKVAKKWIVDCTSLGGSNYDFQVNIDDVMSYYGGNVSTGTNQVIGSLVALTAPDIVTEDIMTHRFVEAVDRLSNVADVAQPGVNGLISVKAVYNYNAWKRMPDNTSFSIDLLDVHNIVIDTNASISCAAPKNLKSGPVRLSVRNVGGTGDISFSGLYAKSGSFTLNGLKAGADSVTRFEGWCDGTTITFYDKY